MSQIVLFVLFAAGCMLLPWSLDRKTGVTMVLYGKNNKVHRLTEAQLRFVRKYPWLRTMVSVLMIVSSVSLYENQDEAYSLQFVGSVMGLFASFVALIYVTYRAGLLAAKTMFK